MRPSENPEVIVILDKLPECKVVHDALSFSALKDVIPSPQSLWDSDSFGVRFHSQTRQTDFASPATDYEGRPVAQADTWQNNPEFKVKEEDRLIVRKAAQYILDLNNVHIFDRAFNRLTGRTKAAKQILKQI